MTTCTNRPRHLSQWRMSPVCAIVVNMTTTALIPYLRKSSGEDPAGSHARQRGAIHAWAQQHGGPWPSTTDPSATSVGAAALDRFVRPVTYQSLSDEWLPPALQAANPWSLPRRVNGVLRPPGATP